MMGTSSTTEAISPPLVARPGGSEASMNLDPGEFVLVRSSGPAPMFDDAVQVDASADGTTITGTIRNNLPVELTQVAILVGFSETSVDRLGAGEERAFTVEQPRSMADAPFPEYRAWKLPPTDAGSSDMGVRMGAVCGPNGCMDMNGFGGATPDVDPESEVNPSVWTQYLGTRNDALRSLDTVSVVGWTDDAASPLTTSGGEPVRRGRTAFVARAPISVTALDSVGVRAQVVREADLRPVDRNYDDAIVNGSLYRIMLPTTIDGQPIDPAQISIRFPEHLRSVLVWKPSGEYTVVPEPAAGERIIYQLSADDVAAGVIYVRTRLQDQLNMPANTQPPGMQGTGSTLRSGWEVFTGSVADVTDTGDEVVQAGGMGGGMAVPGTFAPVPMPMIVDDVIAPAAPTVTTAVAGGNGP
jgi:hypothetical protein